MYKIQLDDGEVWITKKAIKKFETINPSQETPTPAVPVQNEPISSFANPVSTPLFFAKDEPLTPLVSQGQNPVTFVGEACGQKSAAKDLTADQILSRRFLIDTEPRQVRPRHQNQLFQLINTGMERHLVDWYSDNNYLSANPFRFQDICAEKFGFYATPEDFAEFVAEIGYCLHSRNIEWDFE